MTTSDLLSTEQVAAALNVPLRTVQHWCDSGLLAGARKIGTGHRAPYAIPAASVRSFQRPKRGPKPHAADPPAPPDPAPT